MAHIPKPFKRPSIDLGNSYDAYHRTWGDWPVTQLHSGDIIPDFGALAPESNLEADGTILFLHAVNAVTGERKTFKWEKKNLFSDEPLPTIWAFH